MLVWCFNRVRGLYLKHLVWLKFEADFSTLSCTKNADLHLFRQHKTAQKKSVRRIRKALRAFLIAGRTFSELPNRTRSAGLRFGLGPDLVNKPRFSNIFIEKRGLLCLGSLVVSWASAFCRHGTFFQNNLGFYMPKSDAVVIHEIIRFAASFWSNKRRQAR